VPELEVLTQSVVEQWHDYTLRRLQRGKRIAHAPQHPFSAYYPETCARSVEELGLVESFRRRISAAKQLLRRRTRAVS